MLLVFTFSWLLFFIAAWLFMSPSCVQLRHVENGRQCFENAFLCENKMTLFAIGTLLTHGSRVMCKKFICRKIQKCAWCRNSTKVQTTLMHNWIHDCGIKAPYVQILAKNGYVNVNQ